jgi:hypothetical protein
MRSDGGPQERPPSISTLPSGRAPLEPGDVVRWQDRFALVDDVAHFPDAGTYVTITFLDGRGLPVCVEVAQMADAAVWHRAGPLAELLPWGA